MTDNVFRGINPIAYDAIFSEDLEAMPEPAFSRRVQGIPLPPGLNAVAWSGTAKVDG